MTTSVVAVRKDASFKEMAAMLRSRRISAFPVVDDAGRVIGVVSEGDLLVKEAVQADGTSLFAALRHLKEDDKATGITAGDLMTGPAVTIGPDVPVEDAARVMYDRRVKRLPVVNTAGRCSGSSAGSTCWPCSAARTRRSGTRSCAGCFRASRRQHRRTSSVAVRDGIVTITGDAQTDQAGRAIIDAIRHVQGVVAVRDRLSVPRHD